MRYFVQNTLRLTTVMRETVLDGAYTECTIWRQHDGIRKKDLEGWPSMEYLLSI
jgi:hypothetical protein